MASEPSPPPAASARELAIVNRLFGTRPIILHAHGLLRHKPVWPRLRAAVFAAPPRQLGPVEGLTLLTCSNGHSAMGLFERSAERLGLPVRISGQEVTEWVNSRDKPRAILTALERIDSEYVLYADSRDAVILGDPRAALARLPPGCDLWFGGDRINWPALPRFRDYERSLPGAAESEFRYLNGGAWIGRTELCRRFYEHVVRTPPVPQAADSEQGILKTLFPEYYPRVRLDYRCEVFQNVGFVLTDIFDVIGGAPG